MGGHDIAWLPTHLLAATSLTPQYYTWKHSMKDSTIVSAQNCCRLAGRRKLDNQVLCTLQCTMCQAIELGSLKVLKSKGLVFAQFWSKSENSFSKWWKTVQKLKEKYCHHIFVKNVTFISKKTCSWCQWNLKFCTQANNIEPKKTAQNIFFHWGQEHCENGIWNFQIFTKYLPNISTLTTSFSLYSFL